MADTLGYAIVYRSGMTHFLTLRTLAGVRRHLARIMRSGDSTNMDVRSIHLVVDGIEDRMGSNLADAILGKDPQGRWIRVDEANRKSVVFWRRRSATPDSIRRPAVPGSPGG